LENPAIFMHLTSSDLKADLQFCNGMEPMANAFVARQPTVKCWADQNAAALSPRREEVLGAIKAGMTERQAAETLGVSHHTVHSHVMAIYQRMGVKSRAQLLSRWTSEAH
jgi:DNA-binding NarL/FixJ family response regulator